MTWNHGDAVHHSNGRGLFLFLSAILVSRGSQKPPCTCLKTGSNLIHKLRNLSVI